MIGIPRLIQAVAQAIRAGGIGRPVFVRCVAHALPESDKTKLLADLAVAAEHWVDDRISGMYAVPSAPGAPATLCVTFCHGATALLSTATTAGPAIDLIVLGNRGAIYHEGLPAETVRTETPEPHRPETDRLRPVIERALKSGEPQKVATEGDQ